MLVRNVPQTKKAERSYHTEHRNNTQQLLQQHRTCHTFMQHDRVSSAHTFSLCCLSCVATALPRHSRHELRNLAVPAIQAFRRIVYAHHDGVSLCVCGACSGPVHVQFSIDDDELVAPCCSGYFKLIIAKFSLAKLSMQSLIGLIQHNKYTRQAERSALAFSLSLAL